jgi:prepilin-type N-terminal cleavage/methylation domain-containing protein
MKLKDLLPSLPFSLINLSMKYVVAGAASRVARGLLITTGHKRLGKIGLSWSPPATCDRSGFTLVEMAIVLVIIGLIVGGVLVGKDMINAAAIRAQVSQIEKFNVAVNVFREKYACLPGDCANGSNFGFQARGTGCFMPGRGDGNGIIEGSNFGCNANLGWFQSQGETIVFWVDLSAAGLINQSFNTASETAMPPIDPVTLASTPSVDSYLPQAAINQGNSIYAWSGGVVDNSIAGTARNGLNYFGLAGITQISQGGGPAITYALSPAQAYAIDNKVDDGFPGSGRVTTTMVTASPRWVGGAYPNGAIAQSAWSGSCVDNRGNASNPLQYSTAYSNGSGMNCALSFQFQ